MKIYYENILVGKVVTNQSLTVDQALELINFNEENFISENRLEDIDYNEFKTVY